LAVASVLLLSIAIGNMRPKQNKKEFARKPDEVEILVTHQNAHISDTCFFPETLCFSAKEVLFSRKQKHMNRQAPVAAIRNRLSWSNDRELNPRSPCAGHEKCSQG